MPATFSTTLTPTPSAGKGVPYNWFTKLLDNTLALKQGDQAVDYLLGSQVLVTTTGTINDHNPTGMDVQWNGASAATFTGIVAHGAGDIRIYHNVTTAQSLAFSHEATGSAAANRFKLPAALQYIGPNGSIGFKYDSNISRWVTLFINPGKPFDFAYNSSLFIANGGGTWSFPSGATNLVTYSWSQQGAWVDITMLAQSTTTSGTINYLQVPLPGAFTASRSQVLGISDCKNNGTALVGLVFVAATSGIIQAYRQDRAVWAAGTANNDLGFTVRVFVS